MHDLNSAATLAHPPARGEGAERAAGEAGFVHVHVHENVYDNVVVNVDESKRTCLTAATLLLPRHRHAMCNCQTRARIGRSHEPAMNSPSPKVSIAPMRNLVASIDQGTNTVRLLVVDAAEQPPRPVALEQRIVRLGGGFSETGKITDAAIERAFAAQREYSAILRNLGCTDITAVGTGVLRQAPNAAAFIDLVRREAGIPLEIITGETEAELSVLGALGALGVAPESSERYLVVDVGGGSTEFALWQRGEIRARVSIPIGVVVLTESELKSDPPTPAQVEAAAARVRALFADLGEVEGPLAEDACRVVGCSGTFTTLTALARGHSAYDPDAITGAELSESDLGALLKDALAIRAEERLARWPVLPRGREDLIVGGMILCREILRRMGRESVLISDGSLLEGVLLHRLARL